MPTSSLAALLPVGHFSPLAAYRTAARFFIGDISFHADILMPCLHYRLCFRPAPLLSNARHAAWYHFPLAILSRRFGHYFFDFSHHRVSGFLFSWSHATSSPAVPLGTA